MYLDDDEDDGDDGVDAVWAMLMSILVLPTVMARMCLASASLRMHCTMPIMVADLLHAAERSTPNIDSILLLQKWCLGAEMCGACGRRCLLNAVLWRGGALGCASHI